MTARMEAKLKKWNWFRRVETIPHGASLDLFPWPRDEKQRGELRGKPADLPQKLGVLYTGAMGVSNAIHDLVAAAEATADDERIAWVFAGDGIFAKDLQTLAERQPNVKFLGTMSKTEVARLYAAADVNVVSFMHAPLFYENSPNKFFEGIAAGLPAVFNRTTWLEPWLKEHECGFVCETPEKMAEMLRVIASMPPREREAVSQRARNLAETVFNCDTLAKQYTELFAPLL
jgi:glycosyltransferase involved in cell wall biosynthesis